MPTAATGVVNAWTSSSTKPNRATAEVGFDVMQVRRHERHNLRGQVVLATVVSATSVVAEVAGSFLC